MKHWLERLLALILPAPPEIGPDEEVVLVDVRTRAEYESGHARGAIHMPPREVGTRWRELKGMGERRILVYCLSGRRAGVAARELRSHGVERVENAGGIGGLRRAGIEMER